MLLLFQTDVCFYEVMLLNKLIPLFILPCTLALYVFDFHFEKLHPALQIEVTAETPDEALAASVSEAPDKTDTTLVTEPTDKSSVAPVSEAVTEAPDISVTEAVTEASAEVNATTDVSVYYPSDLIAEINIYRSSYGLSALSGDSQLDQAAAVRCNELLVSLSHTRPDGRSCSTVYAELGIYPSVWGENLAAGYCTAAGTASDWMSSDGHRANILNPAFTKCGVAHISCDYGYYDYWVILFSD